MSSAIYQQWDFMKETDGGEGAFEHLPVMYPLISINYIVVHTGWSNDKTMSSRVAFTRVAFTRQPHTF